MLYKLNINCENEVKNDILAVLSFSFIIEYVNSAVRLDTLDDLAYFLDFTNGISMRQGTNLVSSVKCVNKNLEINIGTKACEVNNNYIVDEFIINMVNKISNEEKLSTKEIKKLVDDYSVTIFTGNEFLFARNMSSLIYYKNRIFQIDWVKNTMNAKKSYYQNNPYEVIKEEKIIIETHYSKKGIK